MNCFARAIIPLLEKEGTGWREAPPNRAAKRQQSLGPGVSPGLTSLSEASAGGAKDSPTLSPRWGWISKQHLPCAFSRRGIIYQEDLVKHLFAMLLWIAL